MLVVAPLEDPALQRTWERSFAAGRVGPDTRLIAYHVKFPAGRSYWADEFTSALLTDSIDAIAVLAVDSAKATAVPAANIPCAAWIEGQCTAPLIRSLTDESLGKWKRSFAVRLFDFPSGNLVWTQWTSYGGLEFPTVSDVLKFLAETTPKTMVREGLVSRP